MGNGTDTFTYAYAANSSLLASVTGTVHAVTNTWEVTRDALALKENKVGTTLISGYNYTVNNLGQRSNVAQTGTAFAATRNIAWGYDALGQVVSADSDNNPDDRAYEFDAIGNRLKSADSLTLPASNNYTPNALNQYTAVNALNPAYDSDGNMTSGPLSAYPSANSTLQWDGENRLISTTVNGVTTTYQYDSQSRRISKTTSGAATVWVYDGWNPIAEYVSSAITKANTWGMDLSGSMQGAGGVGGLLAVKIGAATYYPTYDGNGNVSEYLDSAGAITAHFEYDPFGRTVVDTDSGGLFSHRFSTKPIDAETVLYYYGYRYYEPVTGRWVNRDPIEEQGGVNLYGFVGNDGLNGWDVLGNCHALSGVVYVSPTDPRAGTIDCVTGKEYAARATADNGEGSHNPSSIRIYPALAKEGQPCNSAPATFMWMRYRAFVHNEVTYIANNTSTINVDYKIEGEVGEVAWTVGTCWRMQGGAKVCGTLFENKKSFTFNNARPQLTNIVLSYTSCESCDGVKKWKRYNVISPGDINGDVTNFPWFVRVKWWGFDHTVKNTWKGR